MNLFRQQMDALKRLGYATINNREEPAKEVTKRGKGGKRKGLA